LKLLPFQLAANYMVEEEIKDWDNVPITKPPRNTSEA
jgi:hypothetical protein